MSRLAPLFLRAFLFSACSFFFYSARRVETSIQPSISNSTKQHPIELIGIIEGQQNIAILRKGTEEQMVSIGSVWKEISVSKITASGVEIIEGGSSRWLRIE